MSDVVRVEIVASTSARVRIDGAGEFVRSFPPATELVVVGASRGAVDDLIRELADDAGATFGIHRVSFWQLVGQLAAAGLARRGLAPASPLGAEALVARTAFQSARDGRLRQLREVSGFPGFARALASTLSELRSAGVGAEMLQQGPEACGDLAELLERFEHELERTSSADRTTLLELARQAIGTADHPLVGLPLLLLDVPVRSLRERQLVAALVEASVAVRMTVPAHDRDTLAALDAMGATHLEVVESSDASLARLRAHLFSEETPPAGEPGDEVRFFSAPGEGRECIEIARSILAEARRGVPFDAMAVFLRAPELHSGHLEAAFRRARIPVHFARGTLRPDPAGRAFLALLACRSEGLSARRFAEYLSFGQVPELTDDGAPPRHRELWQAPVDESLGAAVSQLELFGEEASARTLEEGDAESNGTAGALAVDDGAPCIEGTLRAPWKWEELIVEAAVIGGRDRWRRRLAGLERELVLQMESIAAEEPESARLPARRRELTNLGHLERFALPLIDDLDALPARATWGEWLRALVALVPRVLRDPERVLATLAELEPMAAVGPVTIEEVREVLSERLATLERDPPVQRFGRVFVATPDQARGRTFRVVFVPGLAERIFPRRPREDPLLLDPLRALLSDELERQANRGHEERLRLRLAVGAAEERIFLSYSRVDVSEGRSRVPSFYGLDVDRATRGRIPDYEVFERDAATAASARLAWPAPPDPARAIDAVEHDLAVLGPLLREEDPAKAKGRARYLIALNDHLARSLRTRWLRWVPRSWSAADGLVRTTDATRSALASQSPRSRPYSVSALQRFAACPYQFLLSSIYRLEPREEIAPLEELDPLTRGSIFHRVQAELFRELQGAGALPVTAERLDGASATLDAVLERVAAEYRDELAPAIMRVWDDGVEGMRSDLRAWLRRSVGDAARWRPIHFELAFGLSQSRGYDPASLPEPVVLADGWRLRGAIDLVEERIDGSGLRVTDHKTGVDRTRDNLIVGQGEVLQPVLYSLALEAALERPVEEARLYFCTARGGYTERVVPIRDHSRRHGLEVLEIIERAVTGGHMPPAPRKDACKYCDFRVVCGPHEESRQRRKDHRPLRELDALRRLP